MKTIISINGRGTLTLPKNIRKRLGLAEAGQVMLECDEAGAVTLRPCATYEIEVYSDRRMAEFQEMEAQLEPLMPKLRGALKKARAVKAK